MKKPGIFPLCCYCFGQNVPNNSESPALCFHTIFPTFNQKNSFNLNMFVAINHPHIFRYCP